MDEFTYLSVPISIILGLAVTELLLRLGRAIQARKRVRFYWPALVWIVILLVIAVQSWWALFGLRDYHGWTFLTFLVVLLHPIAFFLMASLVLPDREEFAHAVDLREHYYAQSRWFFASVLLTIAASLVRPVVLYHAMALNLDVAIQGFLFVVALIAMVTKAKWYHVLTVVLFGATLSAYIGLLFMHL